MASTTYFVKKVEILNFRIVTSDKTITEIKQELVLLSIIY